MIKAGWSAPPFNSPSLLNEENAMNNACRWMVCMAMVDDVDVTLNTYELTVTHPITASSFKVADALAIRDPEEEGSYPKFSRVMVLTPFTMKGEGLIEYNIYAGSPIILCSTKYSDIGAAPIGRTENPDFARIKTGNDKAFFNSYAGNGLLLTQSGMISIITSPKGIGGARPRTTWNPNGENTTKDAIFDYCSNRHVVIGTENEPINRDTFGIDSGDNPKTATDFKICRRTFVTRTKDITDGFVSTCEGADDILWGANNQTTKISPKSPYVYHKVIDAGKTKNRLEIRIGDTSSNTSSDFLRMTLMKMGTYEQFSGKDEALLIARDSSLTSKFSFRIAADGSFEVWSGNNMIVRGSEQAFKFQLTADKDGNATMKTPKTIELAAGNSSIKLDAKEGVSIKDSNGHIIKIAADGITVNGKNIVHDAFYDLLIAHQVDFGLSAAVGPVAINPAVIAEIKTKTAPGIGKLKTNLKASPETFNPTDIKTNFPEK